MLSGIGQFFTMATLAGLYTNAVSTYDVAKELKLMLHEPAFGQLGIQLVLAKQLKNNLQMLSMLLLIFAAYEYVINTYQNKLANHSFLYIIHDILKCTWCICMTKAQYLELKQTKGSGASRLGDVFRLQPDLVICTLQVNTTGNTCTVQTVKQLIHTRKWTPILDCLITQLTKVNAHT